MLGWFFISERIVSKRASSRGIDALFSRVKVDNLASLAGPVSETDTIEVEHE